MHFAKHQTHFVCSNCPYFRQTTIYNISPSFSCKIADSHCSITIFCCYSFMFLCKCACGGQIGADAQGPDHTPPADPGQWQAGWSAARQHWHPGPGLQAPHHLQCCVHLRYFLKWKMCSKYFGNHDKTFLTISEIMNMHFSYKSLSSFLGKDRNFSLHPPKYKFLFSSDLYRSRDLTFRLPKYLYTFKSHWKLHIVLFLCFIFIYIYQIRNENLEIWLI